MVRKQGRLAKKAKNSRSDMISLTQIGLFSAASVALIFTPGPDIIYVVTRGMAQGRKAALAAAAGFALGNFVHTLFAVKSRC